MRLADRAVDREILNGLHRDRNARNILRLFVEPANDFDRGFVALVMRLERDQHASAVERGVDAVDSDERREVRDVPILEDRLRQRLLPARHLGKRDVLSGGGDALDGARVLYGEEALRDLNILETGRRQCQDRDDEGQSLVIKHPSEPAVVFVDDELKTALSRPPDPAARFVRTMPHHERAHHRDERQRDDRGKHDRDRERNGEFME